MPHTESSTQSSTEILLKDDNYVKIGVYDIDGQLRTKIYNKTKFLSVLSSGGSAFSSALFGWDIQDKIYETKCLFSKSEKGFGDFYIKYDPKDMVRLPFERNIPLFLGYTQIDKEKVLPVCPRYFLKNILSNVLQAGYNGFCGLELEWYNYKKTRPGASTNIELKDPDICSYSFSKLCLYDRYVEDVCNNCTQLGIEIECFHTETGPSAFEAALKYKDAFTMADNSQLLKTVLKQIGDKHDFSTTFMAKPDIRYAGSAAHIHLSLTSHQGTNVFKSMDQSKPFSQELEWFVGGLLICIPDITPLFAPNINSYKRFIENNWAPVNLTWGLDDRTSAVRVIAPPSCSPDATHIEIRVPGSDANFHFVIGAFMAAGLYGIQNQIEPKTSLIDGGQPRNTSESPEVISKDLYQATIKMNAKESMARKLFGDDFVNHYCSTRFHEWNLWQRAVTDWEIHRYMKLV